MTREEAIFYIKELQKTYASMDKKVAEAIDLAIEALQEPKGDYEFFGGEYAKEGDAESATTTDCISRADAIEAIEGVDWYRVNSKGELVHGSTSDEESWYRAEDVYKVIESLPPVTPTERTGDWIETESDEPCWYRCSECARRTDEASDFTEEMARVKKMLTEADDGRTD